LRQLCKVGKSSGHATSGSASQTLRRVIIAVAENNTSRESLRAQAKRPCKFSPVTFLCDIAAGGHLENEQNAAEHQKTMNKAATNVTQQADKPNRK
jgi:tRNA(Phe) wybutosine-synthesizing methylase Tyw3